MLQKDRPIANANRPVSQSHASPGTVLVVRHRTEYRYVRPVHFGEHRGMFRPRDSHDLRLLDTTLSITPTASIRWLHDVFGNSVVIARFSEDHPANTLVFESVFRARHYPVPVARLNLDPGIRRYPFNSPASEAPDLAPYSARQYPDPDGAVRSWARGFLSSDGTADTLGLLNAMNQAINRDFLYVRRPEDGTQPPVLTLTSRSGTCRDYALLMMEAVRSLGLAARFVSGYLYDETRLDASMLVGGGETHAWLQVYLPGAGWVEFDPTNALTAGRNLIRVAVARDPSQAIPLSGTFVGSDDDAISMHVSVSVSAGS